MCVAKPVAVELRCHATALIRSSNSTSGAILDSHCPSIILSLSVILSFRPSLVSAQYLENQWTDFDQILYPHQH